MPSCYQNWQNAGCGCWDHCCGGCGQVGPKAGVGAFYHLTENWSLRADADATLGLETSCELLYSFSAGIQYAF